MKKILIFIMTLFLPIYMFLGSYVDARANEFILEPPTYATVGTGLLSLMALSGVVPELALLGAFTTVAGLGAYAVSLFTVYAAEEANIDSDAINQWLAGVQAGTVDKTSIVYNAFKDWLRSLTTDSSLDGSKYAHVLDGHSTSYFLNDAHSLWVKPYSSGTVVNPLYVFTTMYNGVRVLCCACDKRLTNLSIRGKELTRPQDGDFSLFYTSLSRTLLIDGVTYYYNYVNALDRESDYPSIESAYRDMFVDASSITEALQNVMNPTADWLNKGGLADTVPDTDISDYPLSGENSLSENLTNIQEKLGDIEAVLEKVLTGEISLDDYRDAAGVITHTQDKVITTDRDKDVPIENYEPNPNLAPDPKPTVVPPSSGENYTVKDLQKVFPFCIPFDLIDFVKVIKTEGKAPVFTFNCSFLGKQFERYTFTIDFSKYNQLAKYCRMGELLLFIISLILLTRNIIRG